MDQPRQPRGMPTDSTPGADPYEPATGVVRARGRSVPAPNSSRPPCVETTLPRFPHQADTLPPFSQVLRAPCPAFRQRAGYTPRDSRSCWCPGVARLVRARTTHSSVVRFPQVSSQRRVSSPLALKLRRRLAAPRTCCASSLSLAAGIPRGSGRPFGTLYSFSRATTCSEHAAAQAPRCAPRRSYPQAST